MSFIYTRTIHFQDTDAAGVVYFANVLSMCHEAYEASLVASGIQLQTFFSNRDRAVPITHASVDFFQPMFCGDRHHIHLTPEQISSSEFWIHYEICPDSTHSEGGESSSKSVARATSHHVSIDPKIRRRTDLSPDLLRWLTQWAA